MDHALTWFEALVAYRLTLPGAELVEANDFSMFAELATTEREINYHCICGHIESRLDALASHAGRPFPG